MRRLVIATVLAALISAGCGEDDQPPTPPPTPPPTGSCCAPAGSCAVTTQGVCLGGAVWTEAAACDPNPCPPPDGACCAPTGTCAVTKQAACPGASTWTMFGVCDPNPCLQPTGACCAPDNGCTVTTSAACSGAWTLHGVCSPSPCATPAGIVLIPSGTFTIGSPPSEPGRWSSAETQHLVTLTKAFYVGVHEVTQAEWENVMARNGSYFPGANRPVESVTWYESVSYCNQRSAAEGLSAAYTITEATYERGQIVSATVAWNRAANGYRLLTEAEWEYACRAGSTTAFCNGGVTDTLCAPVDANLNQVGWFCGNAEGETHDVGARAANAWGLHDMHGNVWEWCWDYWDASYGPDATDPTGPASGSYRVMRGGGWGHDARRCRSAHRADNTPDDRYSGLGLRICRTAP